MGNSPQEKPATEIVAKQFRQILLWPLLLHHVVAGKKSGPLPAGFLDEVTRKLKDQKTWTWDDEHNPTAKLQHLGWYGPKEDYDYSEIIYFHSFVRDFLYGGDGTLPSERSLRVFRRNDLAPFQIKLKSGVVYALTVERCELYLFDSGVSILVLEVRDPDRMPITLSEVMDLQNAMRIAFPRRWDAKGQAKDCPLEIEFKNQAATKQDYANKADFTGIVRDHAELPAAAHLQFLLRPFELYGKVKDGYCYQQIEDQRIPSMSYVAVDEPRAITEWDYARLAFFDDSGESTVGPYSDDYLAEWAKKYAYDRFWQRTASNPPVGDLKQIDGHNRMMRTRWLCSGYGFVVVGADDSAEEKPFYTTQIKENFHHHYFRMGLIAHFHRASILILRDALAEATKLKNDTEKRAAITRVQERMVDFRSRYWFREVSTQLQGQEIFRWWSDLLENEELFQQVSADVDAAAALVRTQQEEEENQNTAKLNATTLKLNSTAVQLSRIAVVAGAFGLAMTFLGLVSNIIAWGFLLAGTHDADWDIGVAWNAFWKLVLVSIAAFVVSLILGGVLWQYLKKLVKFSD
jgi:hypothetical protein